MPRADGSGRKQALEWREVTRVDESCQVECKHCSTQISCKIERIRAHLGKCKKRVACLEEDVDEPDSPRALESILFRPPTPGSGRGRAMSLSVSSFSSTSIDSFDTAWDTGRPSSACSELEHEGRPGSSNSNSQRSLNTPTTPSPTPKKKQRTMGDFAMKTTESQRLMLDKKVANFFYANSIAFNVAESSQFKKLIDALRPGYTPPNRFQLAGSLLDDACEAVDSKLKEELQNCTLTLLQDGWSNVKNDPITATSIHTGKSGFLLDAKDASSEKKTAKYCADLAQRAINDCKEKYNVEVFAFCSDNENKMIRMREILQQDDYFPKILTYGCSSHYLNLLEKEVTPKTVLKHIVEVHKHFRNHHQPHGWLKEKNGLVPQLPNDTRWNSQVACVSTFLENYHKYVEIRKEQDSFNRDIALILDNVGLYREALHLQKQLKEVSCALDKLQGDTATLGDATEIWIDLINNEALEPHKAAMMHRFEQAMTPFHFLANMTDPRYGGNKLTFEQEEEAEAWLLNRNSDFVAAFLAFKIKDDEFFPKSMFSESVVSQFSPSKWWQIMKNKSSKAKTDVLLTADFCQFMKDLHSCPPSSAAIERVFSTFGFVWSKIRNRLGSEKAKKLVKVYRFERAQPKEW